MSMSKSISLFRKDKMIVDKVLEKEFVISSFPLKILS